MPGDRTATFGLLSGVTLAVRKCLGAVIGLLLAFPAVTWGDELECSTSETGIATLTFRPSTDYDEIEIYRDSELIASIAGDATSFVDTSSSEDGHDYELIALLDGEDCTSSHFHDSGHPLRVRRSP